MVPFIRFDANEWVGRHGSLATSRGSKSVAHHGGGAEFGAQKREDLANRIGDRARAAAGIEQTHRTRIGGDVFDHEGAGIARVEETTAAIRDYDLAGVSLCEGRASSALILIGNADRSVKAGDAALGQAGGASALLDAHI